MGKPSPDLNFDAVMKTIASKAVVKYTFEANIGYEGEGTLDEMELRLITGKGGKDYGYRTPIEEKKVLGQAVIDMPGLHSKASLENRNRLIDDCVSGDAWGPMCEVGSQEERATALKKESLYIGGMAPTNDADFAVVFVPGADFEAYNAVLWSCAYFGVGLAVVFQKDFEGLGWYTIWTKNVELMVKAGKKLIVLTKKEAWHKNQKTGLQESERGRIGFAQTMEIMHLREKKYDFVVVDMGHYIENMLPLESTLLISLPGHPKEYEIVKKCIRDVLNRPREHGQVPILGVVNMWGQAPMHVAAHKGYPDIIKTLHDKGEDVNHRSYKGRGVFHRTALFEAVGARKPSCVQQLIDLKADVNAKDQRGKTPLDYAKKDEAVDYELKDYELKVMLMEAGAKLSEDL